jgi:hypothetical protein
VDLPGSAAILAFQNDIQAFRNAGCGYACPAIPCPAAPSDVCDTTTSLCKQ